eukprot:gene8784-6321_t
MMDALNALGSKPHPLAELLYTNIGMHPMMAGNLLDPPSPLSEVAKWFNPTLNASQQTAIQTSLRAKQIGLIHGPPGTGKTSTLVELILQAILRQQRILVTAPSNIAVDTILIRLATAMEAASSSAVGLSAAELDTLSRARRSIVRLGHPARIHPYTQEYSLDNRVFTDEGTEVVEDVRKELKEVRTALAKGGKSIEKYHKQISSGVTAAGDPDATNTTTSRAAQKKDLRREANKLRGEVQERERAVVKGILSQAAVVFATCVGAASHMLTPLNFDLVIVDEAAQALEAATWIPMLRCGHLSTYEELRRERRKIAAFADVGKRSGGRVILAGDHCQLPPTVKSEAAAAQGLSTTLFERVIQFTAPSTGSTAKVFASVTTMLNVQYRMHDVINHWASHAMYEGKLTAHETVKHHSLLDLIRPDEVRADPDADVDCPPVMLFVDTSGAAMYEEDATPENGVALAANTSSKANGKDKVVKSSFSHRNVHEAAIVVDHLVRLLKRYPLSLSCRQIGLITPYNGQVQCLKSLVAENAFLQRRRDIDELDIKTVDGFQGGEKEIILFSFVRSNSDVMGAGRVGFLRDSRRINVAVTRTKRHFVGVGDRLTISSDPFVRGLLQHIEDFGDFLAVEDFQADGGDGLDGGRDGGGSLRSCRRPDEDVERLVAEFQQAAMQTTTSTAASAKQKATPSQSQGGQPRNGKKPATMEAAKAAAATRRDTATVGGASTPVNDAAKEMEKQRHREHIHALLTAFVSPTVSFASLQLACDAFTTQLSPRTASGAAPSPLVTIADRGCALHFSVDLSSFHRLLVHEVAELFVSEKNPTEKILRHRSVGDADQRRLEVWVISSLARDLAAKRQSASALPAVTAVPGASASSTALPPPPPNATPTIASLAAIAHLERQRQKQLQQQAQEKKAKQLEASLKQAATEDDFLDVLIAQNAKEADAKKYRLGNVRPMPNFDKEQAKDKLRQKLDASQQARKVVLSEEEQKAAGGSHKKVVKKPPPNFGGGRLGSK